MNAEDREKSANIARLTVKVGQLANEEAKKLTSVEEHAFAYSTIALSSAFAVIFNTENKADYLEACEHAWRTSRDLQEIFLKYQEVRSKNDLN